MKRYHLIVAAACTMPFYILMSVVSPSIGLGGVLMPLFMLEASGKQLRMEKRLSFLTLAQKVLCLGWQVATFMVVGLHLRINTELSFVAALLMALISVSWLAWELRALTITSPLSHQEKM